MSEPLVLREMPMRTWMDFQLRGLRSRVETERAVVERWSRARSLGASVEGPGVEEHLERGSTLAERTAPTEIVQALGEAALDRAASLVSARNFVLLVADALGTVVRVAGGGEFEDEARRVRLIAGADWSEGVRGTNAIGTAIAERRAVHVHGSAHFARKFHGLVCYAAPITDADGTLVGVLDATSRSLAADDGVAEAVFGAARSIEQALRARAYASAGRAVTRALARSLDRMNGPAIFVEAPGRIARMNAAARVTLRDAAGKDVASSLGTSFEALVAESRAPSASGVVVRTASGPMLARVEPIESTDGRTLALFVFFEEGRAVALPARPRAAAPSAADPFASVFAEDPAMRSAIAWARRIAPSHIPVMLLAETGGGKERMAHAIHAASARAAGPFRAINCGSLAASLLESELFGYGPAAFTGAEKRGREGLLAAADGGTLFLDEVAEMPPAMQAALLRVLEDGTYQRVGETQPRRADVRVICATCRDLDALVESGAFRKDLYFRLRGARVELPPLRARADLLPLARHLLTQLAQQLDRAPTPALSREVERILTAHDWPGNVRELRTTLEVALVLAGDALEIGPEHLPPGLGETVSPSAAAGGAELASAELSALRRVLNEVAGNVSLAAKRLGVARSTLYRMMRKHGLREE
ncbi:MAG: sigma 54-interacting transcriptional regulator [Sandaracinus sp.]